MNIYKHLLLGITLIFFVTTGVYSDESDKKKQYDKDGKKYHEKKSDKNNAVYFCNRL